MGYTNYFRFKNAVNEFSEDFLKDIKTALDDYKKDLHFQKDRYYNLSKDMILFNSRSYDTESFFLTPRSTLIDFSKPNVRERMFNDGVCFCKTRGGTYDEIVCIVLLIALKHYPFNFIIGSDGFEWEVKNKELDFYLRGRWDKALAYVKEKFGYSYVCFADIQKSTINDKIVMVLPDGTEETLPDEEKYLCVLSKDQINNIDKFHPKRFSNILDMQLI